MRLFIAIPVSQAVEGKSGQILAGISHCSQVKWVSKAQLHITLRFIGDMDEALVPKLESLLRNVAVSVAPFEMGLGSLGAFPSLNRPKVLFIPVNLGEDNLRQLEKRISSGLEEIGVKLEEKEFHPHLTLGRVREGKDAHPAVAELQGLCPAQWEPWKVTRFILFNSKLASTGPVYTKISEFLLGNA